MGWERVIVKLVVVVVGGASIRAEYSGVVQVGAGAHDTHTTAQHSTNSTVMMQQ